MFDALQENLGAAFKTLRGQGKLTEANMRDGLKLVEKSLLEADVSYEVARTFMKRVSEQALGEKVLRTRCGPASRSSASSTRSSST